MATSSRLSTKHPFWMWLVINGVSMVILFSAGAWVWWNAKEESQNTIQSETRILTKARIGDLNRRDYRAFVEGLSQEFDQLYVEINRSGESPFRYGQFVSSMVCGNRVLPEANGNSISVRMCRPFNFGFGGVILFVAVYLVLAAASYRIVFSLEKTALGTVLSFVRDQGGETEKIGSWNSLLSKIDELKQDLQSAREKEMVEGRERAIMRLVKQFLHDVGQPLSRLDMKLFRLKGASSEDKTALRETFGEVKSIIRALDTVRDGRESGRSNEFSSEPVQKVEVSAQIDQVLQEWRYRNVAGKNLSSRLSKVESRIQPVEFRRILRNLLQNAVEAGGTECGIQLDLVKSSDATDIRLVDNGIGMSSSVIEHVFEENFTTRKGGSGLGLFHARSVVESWGGKISVRSSSNGSEFTIRLPA